jgi:histone H3/H4
MEDITKPSITRLARQAGVKSISEDCFDAIRQDIYDRLDKVISVALVVNSEHQTKTLMPEDIYNALKLLGCNVTRSTAIGTSTM